MTKKLTTSHQWNLDYPEKVEAARKRYAKKEAKRQKSLTPYQRAQEDFVKAVRKLDMRQKKRRITWASKELKRK